ncbi:sensor histidine kinase [Aestuariivivens sp. NBU2969]|uniref:sensor histidine kinase n=1 Tax=Aestuariivivens sp. NBU2969 TaxID=2873267 RepID=UPI001CBFB23C|nr:histidine kinase [Aestuariivivens sp. NBU2969]
MRNLKKHIDFKLIGILSLVYAVFVIIYSFKNAYLRIYHGRDTAWGNFIFENVLDWCLITVFMIFIAMTTKYLFVKKVKFLHIVIIHLFFSFFIGAFTLGISWGIDLLSTTEADMKNDLSDMVIHFIRLIDLHFLIYISLVTIIYMYYYFKKTQESELRTIKLQDKLSQAHLRFLQTQMHPHFLFNTLNGIHSLIDINTEKSKTMIVDLSDLLRNVLDKKDQNLIELQEELDILKKYIHIKKTRFSDQLTFTIDVEDSLENVLVPNMILQPIIENATKHGYSNVHKTIDVNISIKKAKEKLKIKIENTGKQINESLFALLKKGNGISNINERLKTLYKTEYDLKIYNHESRVITEIIFPIQYSISEISEDYQ